MSWQGIVEPILQQYTESTDGSFVEKKESALVWHYNAADPDFGSLQVTQDSHCAAHRRMDSQLSHILASEAQMAAYSLNMWNGVFVNRFVSY